MTQVPAPLRSYEVVVCVCGGIAAYKAAMLVSRLVQDGAGVTVAMTRNARRFIGELTFRALTGRPVYTTPWRSPALPADGEYGAIPHLKLSETADLIVVAPATANTIAKLAGGLADDLVSDLLLGAACPLLMAPAMNTRMFQHPATQRNIAFLRDHAGITFVGPDEGWLACRDIGPGRMSEPEAILGEVAKQLRTRPPRAGAAVG